MEPVVETRYNLTQSAYEPNSNIITQTRQAILHLDREQRFGKAKKHFYDALNDKTPDNT